MGERALRYAAEARRRGLGDWVADLFGVGAPASSDASSVDLRSSLNAIFSSLDAGRYTNAQAAVAAIEAQAQAAASKPTDDVAGYQRHKKRQGGFDVGRWAGAALTFGGTEVVRAVDPKIGAAVAEVWAPWSVAVSGDPGNLFASVPGWERLARA